MERYLAERALVLRPESMSSERGGLRRFGLWLDTERPHIDRTNFYKTELELGRCLRLPQEGPCECDLYLNCAKFVTTPQYAPRLRERLCIERQLIADAETRSWDREVDRHQLIANRIEALLDELDEPHELEVDDALEPR